MSTLRSGSAGTTNNGGGNGVPGMLYPFHQNVSYVFPSEKNAVHGRILPAFDRSLSKADKSFGTSWVPYRDVHSGQLDPLTNTPAFSGWFIRLEIMRFVGNNGYNYISPKTLYQYGVKGLESQDPCNECFWHVHNLRKQDSNHPASKYIRFQGDGRPQTDSVPFKSSQSGNLLNVYGTNPLDGGKEENMLMFVTQTAMELLLQTLSTQTPRSASPRDANFEDYLYGDVTNPQTGIAFDTRLTKVGTITPNCMRFTKGPQDTDLSGVQTYPVTDEILAGRYDFEDTYSVVKIPSYQEVIDCMVNDGLEPGALEILKEVVGNKANIGAPVATGDAATADKVAEAPSAPPAAPEAPPAPPSAPEAPVVAEKSFWAALPNGVVSVTESKAKAITADIPNTKFMPEDKSLDWTAGSVLFPEAVTTVAPKAPEAPEAPDAPIAPEAPAEEPAPPAATETKAEDTPVSASGDVEALTAERDALVVALNDGTIKPEDVSKLVKLNADIKKLSA